MSIVFFEDSKVVHVLKQIKYDELILVTKTALEDQ